MELCPSSVKAGSTLIARRVLLPVDFTLSGQGAPLCYILPSCVFCITVIHIGSFRFIAVFCVVVSGPGPVIMMVTETCVFSSV